MDDTNRVEWLKRMVLNAPEYSTRAYAEAELRKYNENHDERGRFGSGDGSAVSQKEPWQISVADFVPEVPPVPLRSRFKKSEYKGDVYTADNKSWLGNVYLKDGKGYIVHVQFSKIDETIPREFAPHDFEIVRAAHGTGSSYFDARWKMRMPPEAAK